MTETKTCKTCGIEFPKTEVYFHYANKKKGYLASYCRECDKVRLKKRYLNNREEKLEYQREYNSRPEAKERTNERRRVKRKNDPHIQRMKTAHHAIWKGILNPGSVTKRNKVWNALPYTPWDLRRHLEERFEDWMNWDNRGNVKDCWSLDHIIPQTHFYWETLEDDGFQKCWALSNLRPLCSIKNRQKRNRVDTVISTC